MMVKHVLRYLCSIFSTCYIKINFLINLQEKLSKLKLINFILDPSLVTPDDLCIADLNGDSSLNVLDVVLIVNAILDIN